MMFYDDPPAGTVYDAARRWVTDQGLLPSTRLDDHQVWHVVEQH